MPHSRVSSHNPAQYQVPKQKSQISLQGNSFLPPPSESSQPNGKLSLNRMETGKDNFVAQMIKPFFSILINVYLYCVRW